MGALCSLMEECPRLPFSQQRGLPLERHITDCGGYRRDPTHTHRLPRRAVQHCARRGKEKARTSRANRTGWRAMETLGESNRLHRALMAERSTPPNRARNYATIRSQHWGSDSNRDCTDLEAGRLPLPYPKAQSENEKPRVAFTGGAHESCGRDSPAADQDSRRRISKCQSFIMQLIALRG